MLQVFIHHSAEGCALESLHPVLKGRNNVWSDVSAVSTGIGNYLMYFIKPLKSIQSLLGRETKGCVSVSLKLRQVIEERNAVPLFKAFYPLYLSTSILLFLQLLSLLVISEPDRVLLRVVGGSKKTEISSCRIVVGAKEGFYLILPLGHKGKSRGLYPSC